MNKDLNSIGLDKKTSDTTVVVAMSGGVDSSTRHSNNYRSI